MNYPDKKAYSLAKELRKFREASLLPVTSKINPRAQEQMNEVRRQIDWYAYNEIINQLEFTYKMRKKK